MIKLAGKRLDEKEVERLLETDHPMVDRFTFVPLSVTENQISFKIIIEPRAGVKYYQQRDRYGSPVEPVLKTLTGNEEIGEAYRRLYVMSGEIYAENQSFFPNQEFNDLGIGSALYESQERLYDALGVKRVDLYAVSVGVYVWARQGFDFTHQSTLTETGESFKGFLKREGLPLPRLIQRSWDIANHRRDITIEGYPVGKYWMLRHAPTWEGFKLMDQPIFREVAEKSRQEMRAKRKERIPG